VIVLAVRWYLRFGLSYRDVAELLAERDVEVDHVTVFHRVHRFTPLLAEAARPSRRPVGGSLLCRREGRRRLRYAHGAVDEYGQVIAVYLTAKRNTAAARAFFDWAQTTAVAAPTAVVPARPGRVRSSTPPPATTAGGSQITYKTFGPRHRPLAFGHRHGTKVAQPACLSASS